MLTALDFVDYITAEPFRPFCIILKTGESIDVHFPDMVQVGRSRLQIHAIVGNEQARRWHDVPLTLLEAVEIIY